MNQQPDNFFREKLAGYSKPAPAGAWDRVASGLDKPGKSFTWWKIAASLLLLSTIGYVLWFHALPPIEPPVAQTKGQNPPVMREKDQIKINPSVESQNHAITKESITSAAENISAKKDMPKKVKKHQNITHTLDAAMPNGKEEHNPAVETTLSETPPIEVQPDILPMKKSSALTLTFTVDETNQYLNKNAVSQATPDGKKPSTFKKLLKKANDLKSNQDPFGDLREKKNEILALNFKNEKRGQNK